MSAWLGHVPFAMYIVDVLRPRSIVELGTHYGVSYCAFCQAVKELVLDTRCYAVDTWQGDAQAGFYGPEVLADLEAHHNPLYGGFSRLIQSSFDEASTYFADGAFDLLHIDGLHTYEAVKRDFETWLPKMSERGVVLFHDINVREREFGVWKLWAELKLNYPSFEFVHSHGLGVLAVDKDYPEELQALLHCSEEEAINVRRLFSTIGERLEMAQELQTVKPELVSLRAQMQTASQQVSVLTEQLGERATQIHEKDSLSLAATKQLEESETHLQQNQALLQTVTKQLEESRHALSAQSAQLRQAENFLRENNTQLHVQAQQLEELNKELERRDFKLKSVNWQLQELERRERAASQRAERIALTGSYRLVRALSAPLRVARRRLPTSRNDLVGLSRRLKSLLVRQRPRRSEGPARLSILNAGGLAELPVSDLRAVKELFDAEWYLRENPDVAQAGVHPWEHYRGAGAIEGRAPHPLFDPKFYLKTYPEAAITGQNPFQHYLTQGWKQGLRPNPIFDPSFYRSMYPDIEEAGVEPLTHFITTGFREGRVTCPDETQLESFEAKFEIPREALSSPTPFESDVKAIAFYLPQFHPIPENDEWWGTGFTEWTNVRRGEPQFKNHYQPHVPHDSNYYDLRESQVFERQIQLARDFGVYGFCFYYYWFGGKILLDMPIRRMLERRGPDFPFCICWANENWTRRWDGREREILIAQRHSADDDVAFLENLKAFLLHRNYIRVEGKPLLIVYQTALLPEARATAERWREAFRSQGHGDIYLAAVQTFSDRKPPGDYGFDAVIQFPPHLGASQINHLVEGLDESFRGHVYDYNRTKWSFVDELAELSLSQNIYPGVMPSWDNTARRQTKSSVWINATPESYYDWLRHVTTFLRQHSGNDEKLVFINAWNEWAEGCHLEPDQLFGYAWLNATRLGLQSDTPPVEVRIYS